MALHFQHDGPSNTLPTRWPNHASNTMAQPRFQHASNASNTLPTRWPTMAHASNTMALHERNQQPLTRPEPCAAPCPLCTASMHSPTRGVAPAQPPIWLLLLISFSPRARTLQRPLTLPPSVPLFACVPVELRGAGCCNWRAAARGRLWAALLWGGAAALGAAAQQRAG